MIPAQVTAVTPLHVFAGVQHGMSISIDQAFGVHDDAMRLFGARMRILGTNLAHADTPNYKARDIDFATVLAGQSQHPVSLVSTNAAHIGARQESGFPTLYRIPNQPSLDGNTVEAELEQARFAENALRYQASLMFMRRSVLGLRDALQRGGR